MTSLRALQEALQDGRIAAAVRRREHGDALDVAQQAIAAHQPAVDKLDVLAAAVPAVAGDLDGQSRRELRAKLIRLRALGKQLSGETTSQVLHEARRVLADVDELVQGVAGEVQRGWHRRVQREFTQLRNLGVTLEQLRVAGDLGRRMREIADTGLKLERSFPPRVEHLDALRSGCQARDSALGELAKSGAGLSTFLHKVAESKVTLADVDEETLKWLRREGALARFNVSL
jgi:hypothetical protein